MVKKSFIDNPAVSNIVFYPRKIPEPTLLDPNIKVLKFKINENILIGGFFYLNDSSLPTILLFHGNGEIAADYQYFLDFYFDCGVNLAVIDFRGYGFSSGTPIYSSLISDALPVYNEFYNWMNENHLKDSLFLLGRSLGSVCASEIGSHNPNSLRGIIFESGFASMYNMMTTLFRVRGPGITPEELSKYSNDTRIRKLQKPVLIIHGTQDWIIPCDEGKLIFDNIPEGVEKKLILIEGAGHNNIFSFREEYTNPLKEFIKKHK
ncbi:MAG: alpha/beta hydrolase [Candidatus Hodarchaeota archaeon]